MVRELIVIFVDIFTTLCDIFHSFHSPLFHIYAFDLNTVINE